MSDIKNITKEEAWKRTIQIGKDYEILDPISEKVKITQKYDVFMDDEKNFEKACDKAELDFPDLTGVKNWNRYIIKSITYTFYSFSPSIINEDRELIAQLSFFMAGVFGLLVKEKTILKQ